MNPRNRLLGLPLLAALLLPAGGARGHDLELPIAGHKLLIDTRDEPVFRFHSAGGQRPALDLRHDPASAPSWLVVRGRGANAGGTARIDLDPGKWQTLGRKGRVTGYRYYDAEGTRGGVRSILWRPGRLSIAARGEAWPWSPSGPQDRVDLAFGVEDESVCARFGGRVAQNEAGLYLAYAAAAPNRCPFALCGNGVLEPGEACDDGNLADHDGCSRDCQRTSCDGSPFASTFEAIQQRVFEGGGCSNAICHGAEDGQGGLELSRGLAYNELVDVPSTGSVHSRVEPSAARRSSLYLKLRKALEPDTDIPGSAMPLGLPPLPADLVEAVRTWIEQGAPETGSVAGTEALLGACLPDPVPISIPPMAPPAPEDGIQLVMPGYSLPAESETEICFATYYDLRDAVPERFQDPSGEYFYSQARALRQDPQSHHMAVLSADLPPEAAEHPAFGDWTCVGGSQEGALCDPIDAGSCGEGICRSRIGVNLACIGFGPPGSPHAGLDENTIGGSGGGDATIANRPGFYTRVPIRGFVYWNSHAFNLTTQDHFMAARLNHWFAEDRVQEIEGLRNSASIFIATGQPPYTRDSYCAEHVVEPGTRVLSLSSHTHQRGESFWVLAPDGSRIYENFIYTDPVRTEYDPPLAFDSPEPAERTLTFCATYNNGVAPDGSPDPSTVRRRSTTPTNGFPCRPVACTDGRVGEACDGVEDHASCDSSPGAGDGFCDACPITAGGTTEDEMFILTGFQYRVELP